MGTRSLLFTPVGDREGGSEVSAPRSRASQFRQLVLVVPEYGAPLPEKGLSGRKGPRAERHASAPFSGG